MYRQSIPAVGCSGTGLCLLDGGAGLHNRHAAGDGLVRLGGSGQRRLLQGLCQDLVHMGHRDEGQGIALVKEFVFMAGVEAVLSAARKTID